MAQSAHAVTAAIDPDLEILFRQRTRICLWLGFVFFSLFALLDYLYCRPFFGLFATYRLVYVTVLAGMLLTIDLPPCRRSARGVMVVALLLGTLVISLMTVELGGFVSGYYVGILLMVAGSFSVLPLRAAQALALGGAMYLVYLLTVVLSALPLDERALTALATNTFFFFAIVTITAVQCFDEMETTTAALQAQHNLRDLHGELKLYTDDLEVLVQNRLELLEESDLRFDDLYKAIPDLVVLIDDAATIRMINHHGAALLGAAPEALLETSLLDCLSPPHRDGFQTGVLGPLNQGLTIKGMQMEMLTRDRQTIEVEVSGNRVELPGASDLSQLIIRDITQTKTMERQVLESGQLLDTSRRAAIFGLARLAECRDDTTGAHLLRIREYTRILATELAANPELHPIVTDRFIEDLCLSSALHDIGKVGIPDAILLKPDLLTPAEFETMQDHCLFGSKALTLAGDGMEELGFLHMGREIALHHHERWDGAGYPNGLAGTAIPLSARIVALADVYDALTSSRPYKPAYNHEQARMLIVQESGRRFDPAIVNAFLRREQEFKTARRDLLLLANPGSS